MHVLALYEQENGFWNDVIHWLLVAVPHIVTNMALDRLPTSKMKSEVLTGHIIDPTN